MSVGGSVVEVIDCENKIWINTFDGHSQCAVYVDKTPEARCIEERDRLWWQGGWCYWTPYSHKEGDPSEIKVPKISGSGVNRPNGT